MDLISNLGLGFQTAFTFQNLLYAFMGAFLGTLIGVLPGLGPVATIAMLLPSIYALDATPALIMLAGIYYGAAYGGSTTAILINVPGESSSVVTAIEPRMTSSGRQATLPTGSPSSVSMVSASNSVKAPSTASRMPRPKGKYPGPGRADEPKL